MLFDDQYFRESEVQRFFDSVRMDEVLQHSITETVIHIARKYDKDVIVHIVNASFGNQHLVIRIFENRENSNVVTYKLCDYIDTRSHGDNSTDAILTRVFDNFAQYMENIYGHHTDVTISNEVSVHTCPCCGAPLKMNQHVCDYCKTELW